MEKEKLNSKLLSKPPLLSSRFKFSSPKTLHKNKMAEINKEYAENLLKKRFKCYACFYILNLCFLLINSFRSYDLSTILKINLVKLALIFIVLILLVVFSCCLNQIIKSPMFKHLARVFFIFLNILGTIIFTELSTENHDFSLPNDRFYYFWMGYRLCSITFITKILTRSFSITTSTLLFELIYILVRFNEKIEEIYKSIEIVVMIFAIYVYFFYIYEKFLYDNSQVKLYQKEDNKLFKKMLNRLPEALIILNQNDHLFYSNYNAKNFINNCSKTIIMHNVDQKNQMVILELFQNLNIVMKEEEGNMEEIKKEIDLQNNNISKICDEDAPYLSQKSEKDITAGKCRNSILKMASPATIQARIKEANIKTLLELYQYFKQNMTNYSDPIIQSLLKTHHDSISFDRYKKENYFTLEFYHDSEQEDQFSSLMQELRKFPSEFGFRTFYNIQMSIIEIREQLHFVFLFDDVTLNKKISQIKTDAINYKDMLMASVSHELRTPLNGIINMIEHAMCECPNEISDELLYPALNSSKLLMSIISDFLDYSMINANKLRLAFSRFNLRAACADCIHMIEPQARMKQIHIKLIYKKPTPDVINSEPNRLKQVLLNLLSNAVKFTNQGYVVLEVKPSNINKKIHFSIKDTGIGISIEEKIRIEKIIREDNYLNKVNKNSTGAGLGLKISSKLIELLNVGTNEIEDSSDNGIICQSEFGKGSHFSFEIYDHSGNSLKSMSDTNIFEAKRKFKGKSKGGITVILSPENLREEALSENFKKIEEINEDSSLEESFGQFQNKIIPTLQKFELENEEVNEENIENENELMMKSKFHTRHFKPFTPEKQEIYKFYTIFQPKSKETMKEGEDHLSEEIILEKEENESMEDSLKSRKLGKDNIENSEESHRELDKLEEEKLIQEEKKDLTELTASKPKENTVLIVDDDFYNIEVLRFFLKSMNYTSEFVNNGEEAIEKVNHMATDQVSYIMILMDFNMPVMDGIEATRLLTEQMQKNEIETIPIIGITAYISPEDKEKGIQAGMKQVLNKPIKKDELKVTIEKYLNE